jgi:hypothetical protein
MKKLAILFLLTTVLVGISFGQVSIKEELQFNNITGGNSGDLEPALLSQVDAAASKELGPGEISVSAELTYILTFDGNKGYSFGDNDITAKYALGAGPGTLDFYLKLHDPSATAAAWRFGADYTGLEVGPVSLGFGTYFDYSVAANDVFKGIDKEFIELYADAKFGFGLYIKYGLQFGVGSASNAAGTGSGIKKILYLDANYALLDGKLTVGLEVDDTGDSFENFTAKPYGSYGLTENTSLGAYVKLAKINAPSGDIEVSPGLWYKYTF